jgi:hypothetical protein
VRHVQPLASTASSGWQQQLFYGAPVLGVLVVTLMGSPKSHFKPGLPFLSLNFFTSTSQGCMGRSQERQSLSLLCWVPPFWAVAFHFSLSHSYNYYQA